MFVSFLLPYIDRGVGPAFHWVMAAQASKFGSDELILIADEKYFSKAIKEGFEECSFGVQYRNLDHDQWQRIRKIAIEPEVFDELHNRTHSMLDAFRTILTEDYPPLRNALRSIFRELCSNHRPEAVLSWCNVPSLELAAAEFNLPVIHNELGPFRRPHYQGTAYFDFKGVNGNTSAAEDMAAFLEEVRTRNKVCLLDLPELRRLIMTHPSRLLDDQPVEFKSGAALQVEDDSNLLAFNHGMTNFELIFAARKGIENGELLIRRHPMGHLDYADHLGVRDTSPDSIEFISRCSRIFCINSSVAFEALLLEKPVFLFGDSPASNLSYERMVKCDAQDRIALLNYLFIGYLIPMALLFDAEYYRWRLTNPSLLEIYQKHLAFYRKQQSAENREPLDRMKYAKLWRDLGNRDRSLGWFYATCTAPEEPQDRKLEALCAFYEMCSELEGDTKQQRLNQFLTALECCGPRLLGSRWRLSEAFIELEYWDRARSWYLALLDCQEKDSTSRIDIMRALAEIDIRLNRMDWTAWIDRIAECVASQEIANDVDVYRVASLYEKSANYALSAQWFYRTLAVAKSDTVRAGAYFHLGCINLCQGRAFNAIHDFEKCLELDPNHRKARQKLEEICRPISFVSKAC